MKVIKYFVFITFFILIKFNAFAQVWKPVEGEITPGWVGVYSMVIDSSDNTLIIGGDFDTINNVVAHYIARWNGYNWTPIGINLPIKPNSLAFFNNELYASSYSSSNHKIYKWNGTTWTVFANSNNYIYTLQTHNGKLYAGGYFSHIGSIAANGIAAWDGTSWSEIGGGFQNLGTEFIQSIEFQDTILYVSGHFDNMNGGVAARNIAGWNGTNWFPLGSGLIDYNGFSPGYANDMEIFNNNLYVGGHFDTAGNIPITGTAVWNGSNWDSVGNGLVYLSNARSLAVFHNELYTGTDGPFQGFNAVIGRFDGQNWVNVGNGIQQGAVLAMVVYNNELYAAGGLAIPFGSETITDIARFGVINLQASNLTCSNNCDGAVTVIDSVGVPPHSYLWSDGQTTKTAVGLCAGVYYISVTDGSGSVTEATVTISAPPVITFMQSSTNATCATCNDGSATVTASGGVGNLHYQWSNGDTTTAITNQSYGWYTVTVTDSSSCAVTDSIYINYNATANASSQNSLCFESCTGSSSAASNGIAPFTYTWSNGATTDSIENLCAGTFTVTITDSNGVAATDTIVITEPTQLLFTDTTTNTNCQICNNGSATVTANGGTPPFTYLWSNGTTTQIADSLIAGTYALTITDANNCQVVDTVTVGFDVGINEQLSTNNQQLIISPNPATNELTIEVLNGITPREIEITDVFGKIIYKVQPNFPISIINCQLFPSGIYFIKVQMQSGETEIKKFVKQ